MHRFIYRYKYLPDMLGIEGVVANGTIKFTCPAEFNDPFDCMPSSKFGSFSKMKEKNPKMYAVTVRNIKNPAKRVEATRRDNPELSQKER